MVTVNSMKTFVNVNGENCKLVIGNKFIGLSLKKSLINTPPNFSNKLLLMTSELFKEDISVVVNDKKIAIVYSRNCNSYIDNIGVSGVNIIESRLKDIMKQIINLLGSHKDIDHDNYFFTGSCLPRYSKIIDRSSLN